MERDDIFCALRQISAAPAGFLTALATTKAAAAQQRPRAPQLRLQALCVAPAKKKGSRVLVYRSFSRGFIYSAFHAKEIQGALCTTLARRTAARRIFSLRLPREKPSNAPGRRPRTAACHEKASRAQRQVRQPESLCALQWPRQRHRPAAATWQQFLQEVLRLPRESQPGSCIYCRCHKKKSRGPVTATCAAAVPGGFMFCTCLRPRAAAALAAPFTALSTGKMSELHFTTTLL